GWIWSLCGMLVGLWIVLLVSGMRARRVGVAGVLWGVAGMLMSIILAAGVVGGIWRITPRQWGMQHPGLFITGAAVLGGIVVVGIVALLLRRAEGRELLVGALFWWAV